jgi:hypothetical protein
VPRSLFGEVAPTQQWATDTVLIMLVTDGASGPSTPKFGLALVTLIMSESRPMTVAAEVDTRLQDTISAAYSIVLEEFQTFPDAKQLDVIVAVYVTLSRLFGTIGEIFESYLPSPCQQHTQAVSSLKDICPRSLESLQLQIFLTSLISYPNLCRIQTTRRTT